MKTYHLDENVMAYARRDFVRFSEDATVDEALRSLRERPPEGRIVYFYVTDADGVLKGVVPTRRLLMSRPELPIREIMLTRIVTISQEATLLDACEMFMMHRLLAVPVVDGQKRLVGVVDVEVYTDEITDLARKEESDDFFQLIGVRLAEIRKAGLGVVFANRFPWLLCNIAGGLIAAGIAGMFQEVLDRVVALAMFIPIVLALAESVSIQSLTLSLQAHHSHRGTSPREMLREVGREIPLGLLLGTACGITVGLVAGIWRQDWGLAAVIVGSICVSVTAGTLMGLLVPGGLRLLKMDPRIASGPIVLTLTDMATLIAYLGLAAWHFA